MRLKGNINQISDMEAIKIQHRIQIQDFYQLKLVTKNPHITILNICKFFSVYELITSKMFAQYFLTNVNGERGQNSITIIVQGLYYLI
ncbi:unnamed protein product [Paramecium octaurelia]|uniref:Uncharacterized protein n=1 Tax=Paramecium octaurelia TaxID=43137 RepID=A0A8S1Y425_PAROT|nr:unnamed protein product [Paramecium octaurelia]